MRRVWFVAALAAVSMWASQAAATVMIAEFSGTINGGSDANNLQ